MKFDATKQEQEAITEIIKRAEAIAAKFEIKIDRVSLRMDIDAAHSNGCPLDFAGMIESNDADLAHDVFGIIRHIDRKTGKLGGCFVPRHARKYAA